jgi:hypothetical protein
MLARAVETLLAGLKNTAWEKRDGTTFALGKFEDTTASPVRAAHPAGFPAFTEKSC